MYDVLTFGEALLRLTPPGYRRLEQTSTLEMHIAGSELNTAIGLARMGIKVRWASRLTNNALGRLVAQTLISQGVDTSAIRWTPDDRLGTYYMEEGKGIRASQVIYDRVNSAISRVQPDDIDFASLLQKPPRLVHLTGITPALSDSAAATTQQLADQCRKQGVKLSFDLNYRAKLWDIETACTVCTPLMKQADYLFIPARDAHAMLGTNDLDDLHQRYPQSVIVMTQGEKGASAITKDGKQKYHQSIFQTETVCRVGGGDAFAAGFLYGCLQDVDVAACLKYGAAIAALKYSLPGDMPLVEAQTVHNLVQSDKHQDISR